VAHQFLRTSEGRWCRNALTVFHRWLGERALVLSDLTSSHIEQFWQQQEQKKLAYSTWYVRRCRIHKYLYWLDQKGHLHFAVDPPRLHHMRTSLPRPAQRFFDHCGNRRHEPAVKNLHDWMRRKRIALSELTPAHLETFLRQPIVHLIADNTSVQLRRHLEPYLLWLHDQGLVSFRATRDIYRPFPLPDVAQGFIDSLRPVLKASTCSGYVVDIRDLHAWLDAEGLPIESLDRRAVERWMKSLADRDLAPATRCHRVVHARSYLRWLAEHGTITTDPDYLLRTTDLPKLPSYLPRPFPMDADHELQRRFLQAGTIYGQALFLMRRSGMRVGELARLEPRCLDEDLQGRVFLKVPLGKLDNERLVPIDDQTSQLTRTLQTRSQTDSAFLIEPHFARSTVIEYLRAALKDVAEGLDIPGPVVSHRLRHTAASG
jgi:site-specific recombinase XerD